MEYVYQTIAMELKTPSKYKLQLKSRLELVTKTLNNLKRLKKEAKQRDLTINRNK